MGTLVKLNQTKQDTAQETVASNPGGGRLVRIAQQEQTVQQPQQQTQSAANNPLLDVLPSPSTATQNRWSGIDPQLPMLKLPDVQTAQKGVSSAQARFDTAAENAALTGDVEGLKRASGALDAAKLGVSEAERRGNRTVYAAPSEVEDARKQLEEARAALDAGRKENNQLYQKQHYATKDMSDREAALETAYELAKANAARYGVEEEKESFGKRALNFAGELGESLQLGMQQPLSAIDQADYWIGAKLGLYDSEDEFKKEQAFAIQNDISTRAGELTEGKPYWQQKLLEGFQSAGNILGSTASLYASGIPAVAGQVVAPAAAKLAGAEAGLGASTSGKVVAGASRFAGNLLGDLAVSGTNAAISAQSGVNKYSEAKNAGASDGDAFAAAMGAAAAEYFSNKLFSGTPLEDSPEEKGYVVELIEDAAKKLDKSDALARILGSKGGKIGSAVFDKVGEGLEEVITGVFDPLIDRLSFDRERDLATAGELLDEFIGGVVMSVIVGAPGAVGNGIGKIQENAAYRQIGSNVENVRGLVNIGRGYGGEAGEIAERIAAKLDAGKEVSNAEIGRLYIAAEREMEKAAEREAEKAAENENAAPAGTAVSTAVNDNPAGYTEQEVTEIRKEAKTFRNVVAGLDTSVSNFFQKWRNGRKSHQGEKLEKLYVGKLNAETASKVSDILGYQVSERNIIVTNDDVKHISDQHPELDGWVFDSLPEVVAAPDSVLRGHDGTGKNSGKTGVIFQKTMPGGNVVSVQFDNPGRGTMQITTVYVTKKAKAATSETTAGNPTAVRTPEVSEPAPFATPTVAQNGNGVKGETEFAQTVSELARAEAELERMEAEYKETEDRFLNARDAEEARRLMPEAQAAYNRLAEFREYVENLKQKAAAVSEDTAAQNSNNAESASTAAERTAERTDDDRTHGLVMDQYWRRAYLPSKTSRALDALGEVLGVEIRFAEQVTDSKGNAANAMYQDGVITISLDADTPVATAAIHEAVHAVRNASPEAYAELESFVRSAMSEGQLQFNQEVRRRLYGEQSEDYLTEEVVADAFGRMLDDETLLKRFAQDNRTAAQKLRDALRDIVNAVRRFLLRQNKHLTQLQRDAFSDLAERTIAMESLLESAIREAGEQGVRMDGEARNSFTRLTDEQVQAEAERMEKEGRVPGEIWEALGAARTMDGKGWRTEIDDSGMRYKSANGTLLSDIIDHEDLFRTYPQLRNVKVKFQTLNTRENGYYDEENNTIILSSTLQSKPESTLLHEIQHVIQSIDKTPRGASPEYWARREYETGDLVTNRLQEQYDRILNQLPRAEQNRYIRYTELEMELERLFLSDENSEDGRRYTELEREQDAIYEELYPNKWFRDLLDLSRRMTDTEGEYMRMYQNTAGEIEARDTAARRNLTAEQRRRVAPKRADENTVFAEGSGESLEINKQFRDDIKRWEKSGKLAGENFTLGSTGPVLQGLGAIESDIYMDGDKINTILKEHPEMSIREIQRIPEVLEDPALILKSRNSGRSARENTRMVMFGSLKAQDGRPVLCVLDLRPVENGFVLDNMQKVNSAYTKDNKPVEFVKESAVLYADKKRATHLLSDIGFQMPMSCDQSGYIGRITYSHGNVKLDGVPFSSVFSLGKAEEPMFSLKEDSEGRELTEAQQEFFKDSKIRDAGGRLMTMYHGTTAYNEITRFRKGHSGWLGPGIYLTSRKTDAQHYADAMGIGDGTVYELYANVSNPLVVTQSNPVPEILMAAYGRKSVYESRSAKQGNDTNIVTPADIKKLQSKGYDGIRWDFGKATELSVFSSEQLKRVDNQNPTNNPDIRYSKKGEAEVVEDLRKEQGAREQEILEDYVKRYGAIPKGERAARAVEVPKQTDDDSRVSRTVRTVMEAKATPDSALPTIEKLVADGEFSYEIYSDKAAVADATRKIKDVGWLASLDKWRSDVKSGKVSKAGTAMGWALYNNAVNAGDMEVALDVLTNMVEHQRSAAQALQATRILKKLSPEAQLYGVQRSVANLQEELNNRFRGKKKKAPELKIDPALAEQLMKAKDQTARDKILADIYRDIGRQMPTSLLDRWNAWRYLAMLGNPRTHVRNTAGNIGFAPVVGTKDLLATGIEAAVYHLGGKKLNRSKAFGKDFGKLMSAAWGDYKSVADAAMGGGKYNDIAVQNKYINEGRRIFGNLRTDSKNAMVRRAAETWNRTVGAALERFRVFNGKALDAEDMWFSQPHYAFAMAQYCKANGITAEQIRNGEGLEGAREYAVLEAQKATYRDTNDFSQMISQLGRYHGNNKAAAFGSKLLEGVLPFRKTPANILVRGVEYSPIGLLNGIYKATYGVQKGKYTGAQAIDSISAGLTGTGLLALGVFLAAQGLVRGGGEDDEKKKKYKELEGHQSYALELPNGTSVTLDWLAPECLPFFVGVNLWEEMKKTGDENTTLSSILSATSSITEPMLEMSCLQSLNDIFESVGYATDASVEGLPSAVISAITSYLTQAFPTLLGQVERTIEDKRYTTFTQKDAFLTSDAQYTIGRASARIPGWDFQQIPYIDAWGRTEDSGSVGTRALNNFLNPAYTSKIQTDEVDDELERLYDATDSGSVLPERPDKYISLSGGKYYLTSDEYVSYAVERGQRSREAVEELISSADYRQMDDEERAKAVSNAYNTAKREAMREVFGTEFALQAAGKDVYGKAQEAVENGSTWDAFYQSYYGTKGMDSGWEKWLTVAEQPLDDATKLGTLSAMMSDSQFEKVEDAAEAGITTYRYIKFRYELSELESKTKENVLSIIDAMPITDAQKDFLYLQQGYKESAIGDAPWNR